MLKKKICKKKGFFQGTNEGYALAYGTQTCPENLPRTWEYYDYEDTGEFVSDEKAYMRCSDDPPGPDPEPDTCISGSECDGCEMSVEWEGIKFCCNNHCDSGWINVDPNTDPLCQCGHNK